MEKYAAIQVWDEQKTARTFCPGYYAVRLLKEFKIWHLPGNIDNLSLVAGIFL